MDRPNLGYVPDPASPEAPSSTTTGLRIAAPDEGGRGWVRRLVHDCWRHRALTAASVGASVLGVGLESVGPLLTAVAVDRAVAGSTAGPRPAGRPRSSGWRW